ncbi:MAG: glycosyltransferase family 39 protein [Rhodobacteraceae bacterium]|nr:glycosyltransferase family 39 protein [Paracoccaceae bacterium]
MRTKAEPLAAAISLPLVAVLAIAVLTLGRVALALLDATQLSTDEAQYWAWGQDLAFGAYSKPPLIGWLIRGFTEAFGTSIWAVRLAAPLLHGATALVVLALALRLLPLAAAALAAVFYLTTPAVALGSALITTDTPLLLAAALAFLAQHHLAQRRVSGEPGLGWALGLGLALGLGFLSKYAMVYASFGMALAAWLAPGWRVRARDLAVAVVVAVLMLVPHLLWLAQQGFVTFLHLADTAQPAGADGAFSALPALRFLAEQFVVIGPILFAACLWAMARASRGSDAAGLAALAAAPLAIVTLQALGGKALANWAVLFIVPGVILAAGVLVQHRALTLVSLGLALAVTLAIPVAKVIGTGWQRPDGRLLLARYMGHDVVGAWVTAQAAQLGAATIVSRDRDLLADLEWFATGQPWQVRAIPPPARPANHWELKQPFQPGLDPAPVLVLQRMGAPLPCPTALPAAQLRPGPGQYQGQSLDLIALPDPTCLLAKGAP